MSDSVSLWFLSIRASFSLQWLCNLRKLKYATRKPGGREFLVAVCTARRGLNTPLCFPRQVCDSYPTELYVPKSATAHIIVGSSKFRSRRRFPALSYYYKDNHVSLKACFCFGLCFSSFIINRPFSRGLLPLWCVCVGLNSFSSMWMLLCVQCGPTQLVLKPYLL